MDVHADLGACPDFRHERTACDRKSRTYTPSVGNSFLPCTPETAGGGIEYAWGKFKFEQRKENDCAVKLESGVKFIERVKNCAGVR